MIAVLFSLVFALAGGMMLAHWDVFGMASPAPTPLDRVDVWLTTGDELHKLAAETVYFSPGEGSSPTKISVAESMPPGQHPVDGFGAALTDSAAWLIYSAPEITRTTIMRELFSPTEGIGISYIRLPMGGSDFIVGTQPYTYDDQPLGSTDPLLTSFSIAHDEAYSIPILQQALLLNPKLKVMASPWSAPAWMKSPETLYGGALKSEYHEAYASYFVKFIQAYAAKGIPIYAITVQNEPWFPKTLTETTSYPTMRMEPAEQAHFVKEHLGPAFATHTIRTKIFTWDHNWDGWQYPLDVLSDPLARDYVAGSAWHCYCSDKPNCAENSVDKQTIVHNAYPDQEINFTECTGSLGSSFVVDLEWNFKNLFIGSMRNWSQSVLLFNLALDPSGGPNIGNCADCRGVITIHDKTDWAVDKNVEYYAIGHLSKFVDPGAYRIDSSYLPGTLESVAFRNPDRSTVLVVLNPQDAAQSFDIQWNGRYVSYFLDPKSVATFKWDIQNVYLPLVARDTRIAFQNFEPGNATPGDYFQNKWYTTCLFDTAILHSGSRSIHCLANAGSVGAHGGTVAIYPSSSAPINLSSGTTLSVWVYDTQGSNDIELKLCDDSGCHDQAFWSTNHAVKDGWTEVTWQLSPFTAVDKTQIRSIELYEWNDGGYYFDDVVWR
jgi:glucosylceramidase